MAYFDQDEEEGGNATDALDMAQIAGIFRAAESGDPEAKLKLDSLRETPGISDLNVMPKKAPPNILDSLQFSKIANTQGPSASLPAAKTLPGFNELSALHGSGGEGVKVQDPSQQGRGGRDVMGNLARFGVGLVDLGNAIGNPRAEVGHGGLYQNTIADMRQKQEYQLKQRHDMFEDALKTARELPAEVLTSGQYPELAAAVQKLHEAGAKGDIGNEKLVSGFLTEMARNKKALDDLTMQSQVKQKAAAEEMMRQEQDKAKDARLSQLSQEAEGQGPAADQARLELSQLAPYNYEGQLVDQPTYLKLSQQRDLLNERLASNKLIAGENRAGRLDVARERGADREEARRARDREQAGRYLSHAYDSSLKQRLALATKGADIEDMDPKAQDALLSHAREAALHDITPQLINAAHQHGIKFEDTSERYGELGDPHGRYKVEGQYFDDLPSAMEYLQTLLF